MYLLLGDTSDPVLSALRDVLQGADLEVEVLTEVFSSATFAWCFDSSMSTTSLILENGRRLRNEEIEGVAVRRSRVARTVDGDADEARFLEAEHRAALIGWLWSLRCPVVNRLPASIWFNLRLPAGFWNRALELSDLYPINFLLTNVEQEAHGYRETNRGAIYRPLTGDGHYELEGDAAWDQIAKLAQDFPLRLTPAYKGLRFACVVGQDVIWSPAPLVDSGDTERALTRFVAEAGLGLCEVSFFESNLGPRVVAVDPEPSLEKYDHFSQQRIVNGIAQWLLSSESRLPILSLLGL